MIMNLETSIHNVKRRVATPALRLLEHLSSTTVEADDKGVVDSFALGAQSSVHVSVRSVSVLNCRYSERGPIASSSSSFLSGDKLFSFLN